MPEGTTTSIYALVDSDGAIRYIGKTSDPARRRRAHRQSWDFEHEMVVLELCDHSAWRERERAWIALGKALGWPLLNRHPGGAGAIKGVLFGPMSEDTRKKMSESHLGLKHSPEHVERQRLGIQQEPLQQCTCGRSMRAGALARHTEREGHDRV